MLNEVKIEVPLDVAIPCPMVDFKPKMVCDSCLKCEYYDGVATMITSKIESVEPWEKRYVIRCTHPIERRVKKISMDYKDKVIGE